MRYKLTIDRNLTNCSPELQAVSTLKRWKAEGKLNLIEAEAKANLFSEKRALKPWQRGPSKAGAGKAKFDHVASVLFPSRNVQKLNMLEINDVAHMIKHHGSGNEIFVTGNTENFIDGGRRERLKAVLGVIAMTPDEAVRMLSEIEGWK